MKVLTVAALCVCAIALHAGAQENNADKSAERNWATLNEQAAIAFNSGHFAEALDGFKAALQVAATAEQRATAVNNIGQSLSGLGRNAEAAGQFEIALDAWRHIDPAGTEAVKVAVALASRQTAMNRYADAERTLRTALDGQPHGDESRAAVLNALGGLLNQQDRLIEARESFEAALKLLPEPGENRVDALIGLADLDRVIGNWQLSIRRLHEAISLSRDMNDPILEARALHVLADTYSDMQDPVRAEPALRRAMDLFERTPGSRDRYIATLVSLGVVYRQQGKKRLAELTFRRVLRDNGDASPRSILSLEFLAVLLAQQKRCGEAAQLANRARGIVQDTFGDGSLPLASALATVAFVEQHARDFENAEQHYAQALRIMREQNMLNSSAGLDFANQYAIVLRKRHRGRELKSLNAELDAFRSVATAAN